jgi:hypothetical protein
METYGKGFALEVTPKDRSADVLHYVLTGNLLGGRSLDGVTWEQVDDSEFNRINEKRSKQLLASMRDARKTIEDNIK